MQISKLSSFIVVAMLVAVVFAGLVSIQAVAQTDEATSTVAATTTATTAATRATPAVGAATTATTTTITATTTNPTVGQSITIYVYVKVGGTNLLNKQVTIWHTTPDGKRVEDGTGNTGTYGWYAIFPVLSSTGQYVYHAEFAGDSQYAASSGTVTVDVGAAPTGPTTTTTITADNPSPAVGATVTFQVNVKAGNTVLAKSVAISHTAGGQIWSDGTHTTPYSFTQAYGSTGPRVYTVEFAGDSQYAASTGTVTVNVKSAAPTATTTSITADNTNPAVGSGITLTLTVKAGATVLTNKQVTVTHTYPGSTTPGTDGVKNTGSSGVITFSSGTYGSVGQRVYTAVFAGDSTYGASSGTVTVNVGTTKIATTTTITASNTNPAVGTGITLTVTVKAGTTILTNKQVTVTHTWPGSTTPATDGLFTTDATTGITTFSSGIYGSAGQRVYTVVFAGDSTYGASSGTVTVNV